MEAARSSASSTRAVPTSSVPSSTTPIGVASGTSTSVETLAKGFEELHGRWLELLDLAAGRRLSASEYKEACTFVVSYCLHRDSAVRGGDLCRLFVGPTLLALRDPDEEGRATITSSCFKTKKAYVFQSIILSAESTELWLRYFHDIRPHATNADKCTFFFCNSAGQQITNFGTAMARQIATVVPGTHINATNNRHIVTTAIADAFGTTSREFAITAQARSHQPETAARFYVQRRVEANAKEASKITEAALNTFRPKARGGTRSAEQPAAAAAAAGSAAGAATSAPPDLERTQAGASQPPCWTVDDDDGDQEGVEEEVGEREEELGEDDVCGYEAPTTDDDDDDNEEDESDDNDGNDDDDDPAPSLPPEHGKRERTRPHKAAQQPAQKSMRWQEKESERPLAPLFTKGK